MASSNESRRRRGGSAPTIYDVARESGVAASTVSRAFSRPGRVNSATATRIRATADRLGYRANTLARALPTGKSMMIALVISDPTNPFYFDIISGVQRAAADAAYAMVLIDTEEHQPERKVIANAAPTVDGVILATTRMTDSAIRMSAKLTPLVVLNRVVAGVPSVATDNALGMRLAIQHLAEFGHDTFTYVAGPDASWADGMRWRSMTETTQMLGFRARRVGPFPPTVVGGASAVADLLDHPTTAVVTFNDLMAIGVLQGLNQAEVRVPHEVSVIGFDNVFGTDFCDPPLTTVASPLRSLGKTATQLLLSQVSSTPTYPNRVPMLPVRLIVRKSTAPAIRSTIREHKVRSTGGQPSR
jgi:LacI family transcriptional regulator, repressor for deo operon, udp, cdd, tsx, nupC, and nupG